MGNDTVKKIIIEIQFSSDPDAPSYGNQIFRGIYGNEILGRDYREVKQFLRDNPEMMSILD